MKTRDFQPFARHSERIPRFHTLPTDNGIAEATQSSGSMADFCATKPRRQSTTKYNRSQWKSSNASRRISKPHANNKERYQTQPNTKPALQPQTELRPNKPKAIQKQSRPTQQRVMLCCLCACVLVCLCVCGVRQLGCTQPKPTKDPSTHRTCKEARNPTKTSTKTQGQLCAA